MKVKCPKCKNEFTPDKNQTKILTYAIEKKQPLLFLDCIICKQLIPINPNDLLGEFIGTKETEAPIECPVCQQGKVVFVNSGEGFWGCGECGSIWKNKHDIH